jgi:hypothetical protein
VYLGTNPLTAAILQALLAQLAATSPQGNWPIEVDGFPAGIQTIELVGEHAFASTGSRSGQTAQGFLVQVPVLDPFVGVLLVNGSTVQQLYGADLPLNANTIDVSSAVAPAMIPVTVSGAGSTTGFLTLSLEDATGVFAEHVSLSAPVIGNFTGNAVTSIPTFPHAPAGSVQAITAFTTGIGVSPVYLTGGVSFFDAVPTNATIPVGPVSGSQPTIAKLSNSAFTQVQVTIPFDPTYNGGYAIEIGSQTKGGNFIVTVLVPPSAINGATFVYTVPDVPEMAGVLPSGDLYAVIVTRMGGYAGNPLVVVPTPTAETSIIFDRTKFDVH